ncbi:hypothetical protein LEP1GSC188_0219 [Leptospira weilii serovar Topaz str. LT2116]|uniref:Uncharacterized protein n=1 Tax=Leptospira weilii serovar Topaz str. LT2116 TaxID=1088540 RepID=M3G930_9LEPT|nr:hypothetical protein LEP1GSC188_0219 [Leptospira weilii serovar Topaz str. LT2116]
MNQDLIFQQIMSARVTSVVLFKKKKFSLIFRNYFSLGLIGFPILIFTDSYKIEYRSFERKSRV